jgi:hypothetical protein
LSETRRKKRRSARYLKFARTIVVTAICVGAVVITVLFALRFTRSTYYAGCGGGSYTGQVCIASIVSSWFLRYMRVLGVLAVLALAWTIWAPASRLYFRACGMGDASSTKAAKRVEVVYSNICVITAQVVILFAVIGTMGYVVVWS